MGALEVPWLDVLVGSWWLYPALYGLVVLDAFLVIVPSEVAVAALGALAAATGAPSLPLLIAVAALGAVSGDLACYAIGRAAGLDRWRWQREGRTGAAITRVRDLVLRRPAALIFTARYIPFARIAVNLSVGAARLPLPRYLPLAGAAGLGWALYQVGIGTVFGTLLRDQPVLAVIITIALAIGLGLAVDRLVAAVQAWRRRAAARRAVIRYRAGSDVQGGTMTTTPVRPPFDPEAAGILAAMHEGGFPETFTAEIAPLARQPIPGVPTNLELALQQYPDITHREVTVPGYQGDEIVLSIFEPQGPKSGGGVYWVHGGGMMIGDRFLGAVPLASWVSELGVVGVSVEYRLAPEHAYPYQTEDSYAGLEWFADHSAELGVDPGNIVVAGASAGGNIAAGIVLLARDRKGPAIKGQLLAYPMLDDREPTPSARQFADGGLWNGASCDESWSAFLGDIERGGADVPVYAAPARATDLTGLPPTFIDVGESEIFRDEDIAYAQALWAAGVSVELHVEPGVWHAFESFAPDHPKSQKIERRRSDWLAQILR